MNNCCTDYCEIRITIIKMGIYKPMHKRTNPGTGNTPELPELELSLMAISGTRIIVISKLPNNEENQLFISICRS